MHQINELIGNGMTYASISSTMRTVAHTMKAFALISCMLDEQNMQRSVLQKAQRNFEELPNIQDIYFGHATLTQETVKDLYIHNSVRLEPLMCGHLVSRGGNQLSVDHTFKNARFGRVSGTEGKCAEFNAMLDIMNERGEVAAFWFTHTKSYYDVQEDLFRLRQRPDMNVSAIWTDSKADFPVLRNIFGNVKVMRDIFHWLQDFFRHLHPNEHRQTVMFDASNAVFRLREEDVLKLVNVATNIDITNAHRRTEALRTLNDAIRLRNSRLIQKLMRPLSEISRNLRDLEKKYKGTSVFRETFEKFLETSIMDILEGVYGDPDVQQFVLSVDGEALLTSRSTGQNASFHSYFKRHAGYKEGPVSVHFKTHQHVHRWNMARGKTLGEIEVLDVYDMQLLNDLAVMSSQMGLNVIPCGFVWKYVTPQWKATEGRPKQGALKVNE